MYIISMTISYCFALILLTRKRQSRSNSYLCTFFIIIGNSLLTFFIFDRYIYKDHYEAFRIVDSLIAIPVVICIYFYFVSLLQPQKLKKPFFIKNIAPYLFLLLLVIISHSIYGRVEGINSIEECFQFIHNPTIILRLIAFIYLTLYEIYVVYDILRMHFNYQKFISENYSFQGVSIHWVLYILLLFITLATLHIIRIVNSDILYKVLFGFFSCILLVSIFIIGSRQKELVHPEDFPEESDEDHFHELSQSHAKRVVLKERLLIYFEEQKPYLNKDLKMQDIAQALCTNRSYISQLFHHDLNTSFYTFVNRYRIEYAISMMKNSQQFSIEHYADISGFKSRSVFFSQFKEITGTTPHFYIRKIETLLYNRSKVLRSN